ncbi:MAG: endonuclease III [Planctomycetota bacterium]|nr:MAG: endonuclease III [Planctomycetota bacterium]
MTSLNRYKINKIFDYFKETINPKSDLVYSSDFELLVAVILSAQATDVGVNKVTKDLFPLANTPQKILDLGYDNFESIIKRIGLYKSKARNIFKTCKMLIEDYGNEIPNTKVELRKLPGVGQKTANVVLNIAFGEPTLAVDTHVFRVSNRIGLANSKTPEKTEIELLKIIPKKFLMHAHHYLILHGRYTCVARNPKCEECEISKYCDYASLKID